MIKNKLNNFFGAKTPHKAEFIIAGIISVIVFFCFAHVDIVETANHTWLFLENTFSGNFFGFYENVYAHNNNFYYINAAHYNVVIYIIFGIWQLPVFVICKLFSLAVNTDFLLHYTKIVCALFTLVCAFLVYKIALIMGSQKGEAKYASLAFILSPVVLITAFGMGQYDVISVCFMLFAFLFYAKKKYTHFCFVMGVAIVCKFFAVFWLLPLLLLAEKRILHLIKYFIICLWLYVPTTLMFVGKDGDMNFFNSLLSERLFQSKIVAGGADIPFFLVIYALLLAFCFFYYPASSKQLHSTAIYTGLVSFGLLFLFILWHPQWLVLLTVFIILTTVCAKNKVPWFIADILFAMGFIVMTFIMFPSQIEANLMDFGALGIIAGIHIGGTQYNSLAFYFELIPYLVKMAPIMFGGAILANIVFKAPCKTNILSDSLFGYGVKFAPSHRAWVWGVFFICYVGFYLLPVFFEWSKAIGVI